MLFFLFFFFKNSGFGKVCTVSSGAYRMDCWAVGLPDFSLGAPMWALGKEPNVCVVFGYECNRGCYSGKAVLFCMGAMPVTTEP